MLVKAYPLVLLFGNAGVGKDTAASLLQELYGTERLNVTASAKPLKELARQIFHFTQDQLYGPSENRNQVDGRFAPNSPEFEYLVGSVRNADCRLVTQLVDWASSSRVAPRNPPYLEAHLVANILRDSAFQHQGLSPRAVLQTIGTEFGRSIDRSIWIKESVGESVSAIESGKWMSVITDGRFLNEVHTVKRAGGVVIKLEGDSSIVSGHQSEVEIGSVPVTLIDAVIYNNKEAGTETLKHKLDKLFGPLFSTRVATV